MIATMEELRGALDGTSLATREAFALEVPGGGLAFALQLTPGEVEHTWREARALLPRTGRWPVALTSWVHGTNWSERIRAGEPFLRAAYEPGDPGGDLSPAALVAAAARADPSSLLRVDPDEELAPPDHEEDEPEDAGYLDWFEPEVAALVLLPTPRSWETLAYVSWFAMEGRPAAPFLALLRSWEERFGAELVAHYGTMLQLAVERPPLTEADALQLAREQVAVAPCTTLLPGISLHAHARALMGRRHWFLHERP